ncbi:hypothetical protein TIFTF001_013178 [Ficus carica]|uniref:Uncharacterized protein n=1 Tax=Ficus carica TaxID=3494 RepID=A0AA88A318_FICCA|nr:hypothetical protein TIFTF001_013178 [Ficus carica]
MVPKSTTDLLSIHPLISVSSEFLSHSDPKLTTPIVGDVTSTRGKNCEARCCIWFVLFVPDIVAIHEELLSLVGELLALTVVSLVRQPCGLASPDLLKITMISNGFPSKSLVFHVNSKISDHPQVCRLLR